MKCDICKQIKLDSQIAWDSIQACYTCCDSLNKEERRKACKHRRTSTTLAYFFGENRNTVMCCDCGLELSK